MGTIENIREHIENYGKKIGQGLEIGFWRVHDSDLMIYTITSIANSQGNANIGIE